MSLSISAVIRAILLADPEPTDFRCRTCHHWSGRDKPFGHCLFNPEDEPARAQMPLSRPDDYCDEWELKRGLSSQ